MTYSQIHYSPTIPPTINQSQIDFRSTKTITGVGLIYRAGGPKRLSILLLHPSMYFLAKNEFLEITRRNTLKVIVFSTDQFFCALQRTVITNVLSESRKNQYTLYTDKLDATSMH